MPTAPLLAALVQLAFQMKQQLPDLLLLCGDARPPCLCPSRAWRQWQLLEVLLLPLPAAAVFHHDSPAAAAARQQQQTLQLQQPPEEGCLRY